MREPSARTDRSPALLPAAAVLLAAGTAVAQEQPPVGPHQKANEWFFGPVFFALLVLPILLVALLAWRRSKNRPSSLPVFDDGNFEADVLGSRVPVLVHFARSWNVADRAARAQTEVLAWQNRGAVTVGVLEVDDNPGVMERLPGLEPPAYLLFFQGRKLFHRPGLREAGDLQDEIDRALSREGF